jgi:hypothetical protein
MKWLLGTVVCLFCSLSQAKVPSIPGTVRYDQWSYLTSHNSYAATDYGYFYAQQNLTIKKQLDQGVRGLKLAISVEKGQLLLCHKSPSLTRLLCLGREPMLLQEGLQEVRSFLEQNPDELVTLFLEMYVKACSPLIDETFRKAGLEPYILRPELWSPTHEPWPTVDWMRSQNKRLVIFNYVENTEFCFNKWHHVAENQWGTTHPVKACKERPQSKKHQTRKRTLYLLNYFPMLKFNFDNAYRVINTSGLETFLQRVLTHGLSTGSNHHLLPTFLCLDFVDIGNGLEQITKINTVRQKMHH